MENEGHDIHSTSHEVVHSSVYMHLSIYNGTMHNRREL